ncbi:MAG: hypothetical protein KTR30_11400 [Saprospiraceae bacterium]|nr:hypothetical protein [Saprospiraceae bacterium]
MYKLNWILLCLILIPFSNGSAQIGSKLKNAFKSKKSKASKVELDFSSTPYMPAITMESLLSGGIHLTVDGKLTTKGLSVAFLPTKTKKGEKANYDAFKKEDLLLRAEVVDRLSKNVLGTFHYSVNPVLKIGSVMNQKQVQETDDFIQITAGDFQLDFYAGSTHYYTFPFEVIKKTTDDAYAAFSECLFLKGPWEEWNYFDFTDYNDHQNIVWHHFMDNTTTNIENEFRVEKNCDYKFKYELRKDGKIIGAYDSRMQGSKKGSINLPKDYNSGGSTRTKWINTSVQVTKIPGTNPDVWQQLRRSDFTDGKYEMIVYTIDCTNQEKKRSFPFQVSGGKFVLHQQQNRKAHQDHTSIVEGGPGQFWYRKQ